MRLFQWNVAHAVYLAEVDAEHRAIYQVAAELHQASLGSAPVERILEILRGLIAHSEDHFAHEERLMQSANYQSYDWHKQSHDAARKRLGEFAARVEARGAGEIEPLLEFLSGWLRDHVGIADRMMSAYVRNYQRAHPTA